MKDWKMEEFLGGWSRSGVVPELGISRGCSKKGLISHVEEFRPHHERVGCQLKVLSQRVKCFYFHLRKITQTAMQRKN